MRSRQGSMYDAFGLSTQQLGAPMNGNAASLIPSFSGPMATPGVYLPVSLNPCAPLNG